MSSATESAESPHSANGDGVPVTALSVVVPVYNSEATIGQLVDSVIEELSPEFGKVEVVLVNDGSADGSDARARAAVERHPGAVRYVRLARNFGEHNAVMCGLRYCSGDAVAIIDDDFQNPPAEITKLVRKLEEGFDVVYSYYDTKHHSLFRNLGSAFNDRVATWLLAKPRGLYLSSFKAMNRFMIDTVTEYDGPYPYLDGLVLRSTLSIGQQQCEHSPRAEGRSNYTLRRLIRLWLNMFTSFSVTPLRLSALLGFCMSAFGLLLSVVYVVSWASGGLLLNHQTFPPGWASTIVTITIFGGIQLSVLGMIGEYLGRVFMTQNRQPQSVVHDRYGFDEPDPPKD